MSNITERVELANFIRDNSYNLVSCDIMNESIQHNLSDTVLTKMFELTIGKYNKIDFSDIEKSRGDVTKTKFYKNLNECINSLVDIHSTTDKIPSILVVSDALNNLLSLKNTFEYNFRIKNGPAILIYNSMYYAIMEATSYIIATSIEISKSGDEASVYMIDSKSLCLINSLSRFNKCVADGSISKFIKESVKMEVQEEAISIPDMFGLIKNITNTTANTANSGGLSKFMTDHPKAKTALIAVGVTAAIITIGTRIIPLIREIIYWIYRTKAKISDAAALQAEYLEMGINDLKDLDPNTVVGRNGKLTAEKLIVRQSKHAERFRKISRAFALNADKADRDAKLDMKADKVDLSAVVL